jgi:hypothetical protein
MPSPTPQAYADLVASPTFDPSTSARGSVHNLPTLLPTSPRQLPLPLASLNPPPAKKARGAAAAQAGLVQMAKAFPTAPTQAIISAQHVVSGAATTVPSGAERARARIRQSTTHGPSR